MTASPSRTLAVILHADVVGSTALVQLDESVAHQRMRGAFQSLSDVIGAYGGTTLEIRGDALVAELPRASDAVGAALAFQAASAARNDALPDDIRPEVRIGISLSEVVIADETVTGPGVVLAQRLEQLAKPGGVVVQGSLAETVPTRMPFVFEDLGLRDLKGFDQPVRAFTVRLKPGERIPEPEPTDARGEPIASKEEGPAQPSLELPDKPSIAVLPFDNMSGDPEQEYFADGVVEDLLTTLSKVRHLFVIARNSSFVYKGRSVDVRTVGDELGVRYVLEGGVRKSGSRVRLSAQLVDCLDGHHLWAERYDGRLDDVFKLQDRITQEIVTALEVELSEGEQVRVWRQRSGNPLVYEHFHKSRELYHRFARSTYRQALSEAERALSINPTYAPALILLGYIRADAARFGWLDDPETSLAESLECAHRAMEIDPTLGDAYSHKGYVQLFLGEFDLAQENARKAVSLSPSGADVFHVAAMIHTYSGNAAEGIRLERQALRLNPLMPTNAQVDLGRASIHMGALREACDVLRLVLRREPRWLTARTLLLAALSRLGEADEARQQATEILRISPRFTVARWAGRFPYRSRDDLDTVMRPLRDIGLPEK